MSETPSGGEGEPLAMPLSDEEARGWVAELVKPGGDLMNLISLVRQLGAAEGGYHPADPNTRVARFLGRGLSGRFGLPTQLINLSGQYFEVVFKLINETAAEIRSLAVVSEDVNTDNLERRELLLAAVLPEFSHIHSGADEAEDTLTKRGLNAADTTEFGGTVSALWDEQSARL